MDFFEKAEKIRAQITEDRRFFHSHPGVGFDLKETLHYLKEQLSQLNCTFSPCGKAGIKVVLGQKTGKTLLLRADMDALPIQEETNLPYRSNNGAMHACGHDFHTAILLGVARLLKPIENDLNGRIILMFQPAEEILEGAKDMIKGGILTEPKPEAAIMMHVITGRPIPTGTLILPAPGPGSTAVDYFELRVKGVGCHGSAPHTGVDPITAASHILIALQEIQARELGIKQPGVLTVGSFQGGNAANAIPAEAVLKGTLRSFSDVTRELLKKRLAEISHSIAEAFRAEAELIFTGGCPVLENNKELVNEIGEILKGINNLQTLNAQNAGDGVGSEDFAYISREIPAIMLVLAAGHPDDGFQYPQHHPKADFDEKILPLGTSILAEIAVHWLNR